MPEKRIGQLWFYDKALNYWENEHEKAQDYVRSVGNKLVGNGYSQEEINIILASQDGIPNDTDPRTFGFPESGMRAVELLNGKISATRILHKNLNHAKPIKIGPATLDSLLCEPDDYDCITEEKLPFRNMFFDFLEPVRMAIPFGLGENSIGGVHFYTADAIGLPEGCESQRYTLEIYFMNRNDKMKSMMFHCNPAVNDRFRGSYSTLFFVVDMKEKAVRYLTIDEVSSGLKNGNFINPYLEENFRNCRGIDELECGSFFTTMANFCTNTINYINARNKEVVERTREITVKSSSNGSKPKRETRKEPYYLIKITDPCKYTKEHIPTGKTWTLNERICAMGHNRRYRDDNGEIRMVVWIDPCIKGPENAPWMNQRYQLMGEKIERERKMWKESKL